MPKSLVSLVRDFCDQHFDQHLRHGAVEFFNDLLDLVLIFAGRGDEQGIGIGVGDDKDLAGQFAEVARRLAGVDARAVVIERALSGAIGIGAGERAAESAVAPTASKCAAAASAPTPAAPKAAVASKAGRA